MGSKFGALRVLVLANVGLLEDSNLGSITNYFPSLKVLDIRNSRLTRVTDDGISFLSQSYERLWRINISDNQSVYDRSLVVLSVNLPCLRLLGEIDCGALTGRGIASLMKNKPDLVSLAPTFMRKETIFCEELVDSFRHAWSLSRQEFSCSYIWDGLLMSVAEANIPLQSLVLSHASGFSFDGIQKIMLKHPGIKVLDLGGIDFLTDEVMGVICRDIRSLTSVDVRHCLNLTKTTLYNLMRQCPFLKHIVMNWTKPRMDDAIETVIVVNSQVRFLGIAGNVSLIDECLKKIGRMCPNLRYLDVGHCGGTAFGVC
ncbi:SCF E3 ubiquitin ligase complex F-box protein grrA-like [Rhodamnia argentea]|uniref:SCF E3 ubiquitin ligase complex F-box protein grrA-like n=1 Tax=Rhodamnia argentea TaxID=178133 RepID=A0ABM3H7M4_9MYRT|nr:SCF E3 ubiquitin ligase complex F-box protein grrA-like [Rhodamnia argentea]